MFVEHAPTPLSLSLSLSLSMCVYVSKTQKILNFLNPVANALNFKRKRSSLPNSLLTSLPAQTPWEEGSSVLPAFLSSPSSLALLLSPSAFASFEAPAYQRALPHVHNLLCDKIKNVNN